MNYFIAFFFIFVEQINHIMRKIVFIFALLFTVISYAQEVSTYYFIRHAEKQRQNPDDKDPRLTFNGYKRADKWKVVLSSVKFDAVYSTNYNRTKETAKPTADANNLPILVYNPRSMYSESFQYNTKGKNVLVVGHSNTTPVFVNKILGKDVYKQIDDKNNANLYIVTVRDGKASAVLLKID